MFRCISSNILPPCCGFIYWKVICVCEQSLIVAILILSRATVTHNFLVFSVTQLFLCSSSARRYRRVWRTISAMWSIRACRKSTFKRPSSRCAPRQSPFDNRCVLRIPFRLHLLVPSQNAFLGCLQKMSVITPTF